MCVCVLIFLTESPMSKISLVVWSQVMNHGFFITILRLRGKVRRGTLWALLNQTKHEWANRRSKQCWFFFLQKGNRPHRICSFRTNGQPSFFFKRLPWEAQKKGHSREKGHWRQLDAPSWQRPMWHCPLSHRIFDLNRHSCGSSAPLFTRPQLLNLFTFS